MVKKIFLLILSYILVTMLLISYAHSLTPHDMYHESDYKDWQTMGGNSCCNDNDCHGAEAWRIGSNGYEVKIQGFWIEVPKNAVRPYASPDGNAHVCNLGLHILCFVPGSGV